MGDAEKVRELLASGADFDETDGDGNTALMEACSPNHAPVVRLLIEAGADLEKANNAGRTALKLACKYGPRDACIRLLLDAGASAVGISELEGRHRRAAKDGDTEYVRAAGGGRGGRRGGRG